MHGPLNVKMMCTFRLSDIILTTKYSSSLMLLFRIQDTLFLIVTRRSVIVVIYFFSPSKQNKPQGRCACEVLQCQSGTGISSCNWYTLIMANEGPICVADLSQ